MGLKLSNGNTDKRGLSPTTGYLAHLHLKLRLLEEELHKVIELMNETEPWYDSEKPRPIIPRKKQQG